MGSLIHPVASLKPEHARRHTSYQDKESFKAAQPKA